MQVGVVNLTKALAGGQRKVEEEEREGAHVFHLIHQVHPQATVDYRLMIEQMAFRGNKKFAPKRHICVAEGPGLTNSQLKVLPVRTLLYLKRISGWESYKKENLWRACNLA